EVQALICQPFGLDEGVVETSRQPGVLARQLFSQHERVHDREDAGLLVILALDPAKVGKEPTHTQAKRRRPAGADERVELPRRHHLAQVPPGRHELMPYVRREGYIHFLDERSLAALEPEHVLRHQLDRKSTRLNSSHVAISYAVFCLKKKKKTE